MPSDGNVAIAIRSIGPDVLSKAAEPTSDSDPDDVGYAGAFKIETVAPPYEPEMLCKVYENSNSLRQNVDSYKTNIDGFGHEFEPVILLRESGAREAVADAIYIERNEAATTGNTGGLAALLPPTEQEIDTKIENLRYQMRLEKARVESFFENCCAEMSFVSLRRNTREEVEVTGNAFWEVIRNELGQISQFALIPARSIRLVKTKSQAMTVPLQIRIGPLLWRTETMRRKFRRYAQIAGDTCVHFKEYGDPTIVSSKTGKSYSDIAAMSAAEDGNQVQANEVFHFRIPSVRSGSYGAPRWIGNLLSVLGSRSAEEVNLAYFENKSIPPMAIIVSGGRLAPDATKRLEDWIEVNIKGKKNFHKILIIEAETSAGAIGLTDNASLMRVEIKFLTDAQLKDGLFLQYDAANMDKVGMGFRLPRLLRGDIRDFNRATALASLDFAETQVFLPERNEFDFVMNRFILTELGIRLWRFKSLGPRLSDSQDWGDMITKLTTAGILTPADAREIIGKKVLGHELPLIKADWVNQPLTLTIAGVQVDSNIDGLIPRVNDEPSGLMATKPTPTNPLAPNPTLVQAAKQRIMNKAKELMQLRDLFVATQETEATERYKEQRKSETTEPPLVFKMDADMMKSLGIVRDETP